MGAMGGLTPLAYATPPDSLWTPGVYDDADYDDIVILVTTGLDVVPPLVQVGPEPTPPGASSIRQPDVKIVSAFSPSSSQSRAPPAL